MIPVLSEVRKVEVRTSTICSGRGVFATQPIEVGETFETCPVILVEEEHVRRLLGGPLEHYYYLWRTDQEGAMVLGYGSLYNHSPTPNARYFPDYELLTMRFEAIKPIAPGEEISVNYGGFEGEFDPWW